MNDHQIGAAAGSCLLGMFGGVIGVILGACLGPGYFRGDSLLSELGVLGQVVADLLGLFVGATLGGIVGAVLGASAGAFVATWEPKGSRSTQQPETEEAPLPSASVEAPEEEIARLQREIAELEEEKAILEGETDPKS